MTSKLVSSCQPQLPALVQFALLVAAICHDSDHPGHNNTFEINSKSKLAMEYNIQSVLENHHIAVAICVIESDGCQIIDSLSVDDSKLFMTILKGSRKYKNLSHRYVYILVT